MNSTGDSRDNLFQIQVDRLESLKQDGIEPFGRKYPRSSSIEHAREHFEEDMKVSLAGRLTACRNMGKTRFWDLTDMTGKIQLFLHPKVLDPADHAMLDRLGPGDIVGAAGALFTTRTGEISVKVESLRLLAKALRPLPEKYHGLKDTESRFRRRYLDLIANPEVRSVFLSRSRIIQRLRRTLDEMDFLEVETPMMQTLFGGALARPFTTHHNALDMPLYLRIAPELYLKRLLVGGMEKVYELNRNFRNEGLSKRHNPEFTMLEVYSAFDDCGDMMALCEHLIQSAARDIGVLENCRLPSGESVDLSAPFRRISLFDAVREIGDCGLSSFSDLKDIARREQIENFESLTEDEILAELFETRVEPRLVRPTFVTHFPASLSPLARRDPENPRFAERFELFVDGQEIANAYSEQNDPLEQKARFEEQILKADSGETARKIDTDYLRALEHGMPPAGGLGIGIDRLVMVLTGTPSIREVILFPLMRPEE